ncbi:LPXTG cell wall anchor domain-containing protein [Micromonospora sp. URMC 103]|uniref:LPXTG cell wall anchor domain-containing protein n=1 Tax=Micromonospora sp. URMC 103 TaxID=3423406 RepID=UPI003F1E1D5E
MPQRRRAARAAVLTAAAAASLAIASPAWAAAGKPHNPPGDNGTVKIDGAPFGDSVDNQPHVGCEFELEFFNFDEGETADITLAAHPPTGRTTVKFLDNYVISDDPASGAANDHDAVVRFSANDLALAGLDAQPQQGYHIKLTVDLTDGKGKAKQKVFWLQPCAASPTPTPSTSTPGEGSPTPTPGGSQNPSENPSANPSENPSANPSANPSPSDASGVGGNGGGGDTEGGLPLTGVAVTSISLAGLALIVGGVVLMALRRRRDKITFTS